MSLLRSVTATVNTVCKKLRVEDKGCQFQGLIDFKIDKNIQKFYKLIEINPENVSRTGTPL